jgi:hypothetical protein
MKKRLKTSWLLGLLLILLTTIGSQSILAQEEFGLGDVPMDPILYQKFLKIFPEYKVLTLPTSYDARNDGIVTSAKNQGYCGSCWAFASVGAFESHILKQYGGAARDLSEQQQVSCNTSMSGCCGGSSSAPQYWSSVGPITETCFPYAESGTSCPTTSTVACSSSSGCTQLPHRVTNFYTVGSTAAQMKASLYYDGPSYWRFTVYSDFNAYPTGFWYSGSPGDVYTNGSGTTYQGGHAVLLIGWDDAKSAFLCKNSWGATGGPNNDGTFWIAYSGHYNSLSFGMSNFNLTGGSYQFCYVPGHLGDGTQYKFSKVNGKWLKGVTSGGSCTQATIIGKIDVNIYVLVQDIPTPSPCDETILLVGDYPGGKNYDWIDDTGAYGTGKLSGCTTSSLGAEDLFTGETTTKNGLGDAQFKGTKCLQDNFGMTYNLTIASGRITGTCNTVSCGTVPVTGLIKSKKFIMYVDVPSTTASCDDGLLIIGSVKTLAGTCRSTSAGPPKSISFSKCSTLSADAQHDPDPLRKN